MSTILVLPLQCSLDKQEEPFSAWLSVKSLQTRTKALSDGQCVSLQHNLCVTAQNEIECIIKLHFLERELQN